MDRSLCADPRLLSNTALMALGNTVHSCKSLREACLRAMLMSTSIRMVELTSIKVEDVSISQAVVKLRINAFKSHRSMHRFLAPAITPKLLRTYVQEYHLSPTDYLFPSARDASKPLSIREVSVVFNRWLRDAQIERQQLTPSSIRSSFAHPSHSLTLQRAAEMMGHGSPTRTLD
jgi:site-specific recombinase XerD